MHTATTWHRSASTVVAISVPPRPPAQVPRQRDDHALIGGIDQGAGDATPTRLSTGLAPAGLAPRTWWWLLERRVWGWWPAEVV